VARDIISGPRKKLFRFYIKSLKLPRYPARD
jgi:hypothetical protein